MNVIAALSKFSRKSQLRFLKHAQLSQTAQRNNSESTTHKKEEQTDEHYDQTIKDKILSASLPFVKEFGWSTQALVKGAETIGYPGVSHGMFNQGGADLVHYFNSDCNKKLAAKFKQETEQNKYMVTSKFVNGAVETRLRMIIPYKAWWPQALALMALPPNVQQSLKTSLTFADDICYYSGDRSVDILWYFRRFTVSCLYQGTEIYMLQDKSDDHRNTWEFLKRRTDELFQANDMLVATEKLGSKAPEILTSAATTVINILRG